MPLADTRPPAVDLLVRPATTVTITLEWPTGDLTGRTFTSTLDGDALDVTIDGDVLTVEAPVAVTGGLAAGVDVEWLLLEDLGGGEPEPVMVGTWTPSDDPQATTATALEVTTGAVSVDVTVNSAQASIVALDTRVGGIETAEVTHDWAVTGWDAFSTRFMINNDPAEGGPQEFALTVNGGRGRFTGVRALDGSNSGGNARELLLRDGTLWVDSEVRSIWWGPSTLGGSPINSPQLGHVHRAVEIEPGVWAAFLVWHNIAFSQFQTVHLNAWQGSGIDGGDPGSLGQAAGGSHADASSTERRMAVRFVSRFTFGATVTQVRCMPTSLYGLADGVPVALSNQGPLNFASTAAENVNRVTGFVQVASAGDDQTVAEGGGMLDFAQAWRRYFPQMVASRLVGDTLSMKRWRPEDPEPDWGDPAATATVTVTPSTSVPALPPGPGLCGVAAAHAHSGSYGEYGQLTFRRL